MTSAPTTSTPLTGDLLRGALDLERTDHGLLPHRLPERARRQSNDPQLRMAEGQPAGVRLAFTTSATALELDTRPTRYAYTGAPARPDGVYDLVVDGTLTAQQSAVGGRTETIDLATGERTTDEGPVATLRFEGLPAREKVVEIWLPHNERTELVALRSDAPLAPAPRGDRRVWVHHGSSISHGSNAVNPTGTWPVVAAAAAGLDLVNLGFGGSAMVDQFTARVVRDTPADLISLKLGINVVNADVMRLRAFTSAVHGFLDTVRDGHPTTPLLVVSPIHCPLHEDTPGPGAFDLEALAAGTVRFRAQGDPAEVAAGKLTLSVIRTELERIVAERSVEDPHLTHLDGRELYGPDDYAELPLPDELHPDAVAHRRMGERFADIARTRSWGRVGGDVLVRRQGSAGPPEEFG